MKLPEDAGSEPSRLRANAGLPGGLDAASLQLLHDLKGHPFPEDQAIEDARMQMRDGQTSSLNRPSLSSASYVNGKCEIQLVRRQDASGLLPVLFFLHGGGWVMGDQHTHAYLIGKLAEYSGCAIAFVKYPTAPEARYPEILHCVFAAICAVLAQGEEHHIDPDRFALAGDSAGGNIAAALALRFREPDAPTPRLQILLYPALDCNASSQSYRAFSQDLNLTARSMNWFWSQYAAVPGNYTDPFFCPLAAPSEMLSGLPKTLIITSEFDVLRDEGELYAARLRDAGVDTLSIRFGGVLHGFMVSEVLAKSASGELAIQTVCHFLRAHMINANET